MAAKKIKDYWGTIPFDVSQVKITATAATPQLVTVTTDPLDIFSALYANGKNVYYVAAGFDFYPILLTINAQIMTVPCTDTYIVVKVGISDAMALGGLMLYGNDAALATINPAGNCVIPFANPERFYIPSTQNGNQIKVFYVDGTDDVVASVTLHGYLVKKG